MRTIIQLSASMLVLLASGCQKKADGPTAAPRPAVLRSEEELSAERVQRIEAGSLIESSDANLAPQAVPAPTRVSEPPPFTPHPQAIHADVLMVNEASITVPEVLYSLRRPIAELRSELSGSAYAQKLAQIIRDQTQQLVGAQLLYEKAMSGLQAVQKEQLKAAVDRERAELIAREHSGSEARFISHLDEHGLTDEKFRQLMERDIVVRQYAREMLRPRVTITRDELLAWYEDHREDLGSPEVRELLLIEAPFAAFLPAGVSWARATSADRAEAEARAESHIRAAHGALAQRPFKDVASEFSRGPHAAQAGVFGPISKPLNPPYADISRRIFSLASGQYTDPEKTARGWVLAGCGEVKPAVSPSFAEVQDRVRTELQEQKYNRLTTEYVLRLAEKSSFSELGAFIEAAHRAALRAVPPPE